jgi:hypothetical protein
MVSLYPTVYPVVDHLLKQDDVLRMTMMGRAWAGLVKMQQRYRGASSEDKAKMDEAFWAAGAAVAAKSDPKRKVQTGGKRRKKT